MKRTGWFGLGLLAMVFFYGCATEPVPTLRVGPPPVVDTTAKKPRREGPPSYNVTVRTVTEDEVYAEEGYEGEATPEQRREILARLNARAHYLITEDITKGRPIKAPDDYEAFADWTPLPREVPGAARFDRMILIVKDEAFIGWYERGRLVGDSYACTGVPGEDTEPGIYKVEQKDPDHYSRSYSNSFGQPAWMPWALRIYGTVWVHAGDVWGPLCSHGCIILPVKPAEKLYHWAPQGTTVVVVDRLKDLNATLARR